ALGAKRAGGTKAHAGEAPRVEHGLRPPRFPELHVPVVIDPDVAGENRIIRQYRLAISDDAFRPDWRAMDLEVRPRELVPRRAPAIDLGQPRLGFARRGAAAVELSEQLAQEGARVGEHAEIGRIVAPELGRIGAREAGRIETDRDQLAVGEVPRIAGQP